MKNIIKTTLAIIALSPAHEPAASPQMVSRRSSDCCKNWVVLPVASTTRMTRVASLDMKAADAGAHTTASPVPPV